MSTSTAAKPLMKEYTAANGQVYTVPAKFLCPITHELMNYPLMTITGLSFEMDAIIAWVEQHGTCPVTKQSLAPHQLVSNRSLQSSIRFWRANNGLEVEECLEDHPMVPYVGCTKFPSATCDVSGKSLPAFKRSAPQITLATMAASADFLTTGPAPSMPTKAGKKIGSRKLLARILSSASRELDM